MTILAKGSNIPWESKQAAKDEFIRFLDNNVIEMKLVKGEMYKGEVQRTELRVKKVYSPKEALKLKISYKYTLKTDVNFKGDLVISQLPWDGNSPDNSIRIDTKTKRMYYLNYNQRGNPKRDERTLVPTVKVDQEYEIAYLLDAEENGRGKVDVYLDGEHKAGLSGQILYPPLDPERYLKIGGYLGDTDLPSGLKEIVMQFRDVTLGSTDATFEELTGRKPQQPTEPNQPEEPVAPEPGNNQPDPETNTPDPETNEPKPETANISSKLEDLESEVAQISDSLSRIRQTLRDIYREV